MDAYRFRVDVVADNRAAARAWLNAQLATGYADTTVPEFPAVIVVHDDGEDHDA